ncbi:extracellular solute-binding protein [Actinospica sp. MGRD01-02]|uniref:Extracellular solute-binding protein n=1 Tax=Actinospica acidithermotolerans TaxID=2828514 RepID=A0A941E7L2_9ACTN|nr:extracellular solute-binding protein [Actinospica acidithermotolerans]MBR7825413.1 extracellular solute-binding protein [Actinospica acidithermotolerans]
MPMKRRLAAAATLGLSAALALSACSSSSTSGSSSSGGGSVTLHFFGADYGTAGTSNTTQTYWQNIATAFHKQYPNITVDVQTIDWNDFPTKLHTLLQSKNYPDIIEGDAPQSYAQEGIAYKASDVLSESTLANLIPTFAKQGDYQGTEYGIPFTTSTRALYYNKKLFAQAGISAAPTTWAELQADAAKISKLGNSTIGYGMPLGTEEAQAESYMWMLGAGGGYVNGGGAYTINSAANVTAFNFMNTLVKAGDTEANPGTVNRATLWSDFAAGSVGMVGGSPAVVPIIQAAGKLTSSDWATAPFPGENGTVTNPLGVDDQIVALNVHNQQSAIQQFLNFAYQDTYQAQFDKEYDLLPATTSAATAEENDPIFGPFVKAIPTSSAYPTNANWSDVSTKIKQTIGAAVDGTAPATVLGQIQTFALSNQ